MGWIMIILTVNSITTAEFTTESACEAAGVKYKSSLGRGVGAQYVCVEKGGDYVSGVGIK